MLFQLSELTCKNTTVLNHLRAYMERVSHYNNFDNKMALRVYVDSKKDLTAFEAVEYMLGFTSAGHKLCETIQSPYPPLIVNFADFKAYIDTL